MSLGFSYMSFVIKKNNESLNESTEHPKNEGCDKMCLGGGEGCKRKTKENFDGCVWELHAH